jgi:predicted metalloprotease with PDZ domain
LITFFPRPFLKRVSALALAGFLLPAAGLCAQLAPATPDSPVLNGAGQHAQFPGNQDALLNRGSRGYLGVGTRDLSTERAAELKLKDARGAEIVAIDHDAPAAKAGLRLHDVILSVNEQVVEGEAQLIRILRGTPPGRTIALVISRDGRQQTIRVKLADRAALEARAWSQHTPVPEPGDRDQYALPAAGSSFGSGFFSDLGTNPLYTGLQLDVIGPQLASYFGVASGHGLLVRRVDEDSPGSAAGLRAGDVILRVNGRAVATPSQWEHLLHSNSGKAMRLTVMRDHQEQILRMVAGPAKTSGEMDWPRGETRWIMNRMAVPPAELARELSVAMRQESGRMLAQMESLRHRIEALNGRELE